MALGYRPVGAGRQGALAGRTLDPSIVIPKRQQETDTGEREERQGRDSKMGSSKGSREQ
jgi:hypothetical protein